VSADIVISGLGVGEAVGGASFTLSFVDTILQGVGFGAVIDPEVSAAEPNGNLGAELDLSFGFGPGGSSPLDVFVTAEDFGAPGPADDASALAALQGAGFVLARVNFTALAAGISPLTLGDVVLSNATGTSPINAQIVNGQFCVGASFAQQCAAVPEPAAIALLATGLALAAARRHRC
jgi:hypothetical protein